jgi:hypothetical protein
MHQFGLDARELLAHFDIVWLGCERRFVLLEG